MYQKEEKRRKKEKNYLVLARAGEVGHGRRRQREIDQLQGTPVEAPRLVQARIELLENHVHVAVFDHVGHPAHFAAACGHGVTPSAVADSQALQGLGVLHHTDAVAQQQALKLVFACHNLHPDRSIEKGGGEGGGGNKKKTKKNRAKNILLKRNRED